MKNLHFALIGRGRWGKNIENTLKKFPNVSVTVVGKKTSAPEGIDGVLIATPSSTHAEIALPYIKKGIATFIEKPMTTSFESAHELVATAKESGALIFVGHIHLYNPAFIKLQELLPSAGPIRGLFSEGMNHGPLRSDVSVLWDWLPHDLSMSIQLLGSGPESVACSALNVMRPTKVGLYDIATVTFGFKNNISMISTVSSILPIKRKKLTVTCEKGTFVYDDTAVQKLVFHGNVPESIHADQNGNINIPIVYPEYGKTLPLDCELSAFIDCIRSGNKSMVNFDRELMIISAIDATHKAIGKGIVPIEY